MKGSLVLDIDDHYGALSSQGVIAFGWNWETVVRVAGEDRLDDTDWTVTPLGKVLVPGEFL